MGHHDTSSLGGIINNPRLLGELPIEGPNVLRQSGNYQGTEDAEADAMKQLAARNFEGRNEFGSACGMA
jgi:hypothetical protein